MPHPTELPADAPKRLHAIVAELEGQDRADCVAAHYGRLEASERERDALNRANWETPWKQRGIGKYRGRIYVGR